MERLRRLQLRGPSIAKPSATHVPEKVIVTSQRSAGLGRDVKPSTSSKAQSRHVEGALDLEVLNSKLQQYAQTCNRDEEEDDDDDDDETEEGSAKEPGRVQGVITKESQGTEVVEVETMEKKPPTVKEAADSAFEHVSGATSRHSSQTRASTCPSIVIHPPDDEVPIATEPSDFELFLKQAEDDERTRKEQGLHALPNTKQESSVNPFYSKNLANPSSVPPKLAEIQETGDEEGLAEEEEEPQQDSPAESSDQTLSTQRTASTASSGSNDFAATETQPTRPDTTGLGRHVSFCEPQKLRERSDSHGSAYHARGFESPKALREVTKRRSFRKMVTSYIRHR